MLAALVIVFREVFEAGLIIGIILAVTRSVPRRHLWIGAGIAAGVAGACLIAVFAGRIATLFAGMGQELLNAAILAIAVVMLTWHNVWMARHGKALAGEMHAVGRAVADGSKSLLALAIVVGLAVLREGSEVVLFLYGVVATNDGAGIVLGGLGGVVLGVLICMATYRGLITIPMRQLFTVTTVLISLLAAGMAAQMVAFLERAGWINILGDTVWDSSWLLSDTSLVGSALHTLVGYTDQPSAIQLVVYLACLALTYALIRLVAHEPKPALAAQ